MVKSYLKYEHVKTLGVISSASSNVVWSSDETSATARPTGAGRAIAGAGEDVVCWDIKKGELLSRWSDRACSAEVTAICRSQSDSDIYAVGYADGSIRIWDSRLTTVIISFNGHRSGVTSLSFDDAGVRLASGSQDNSIIIWDLITESGLFRLKGHSNQITGVHFLSQKAIPPEAALPQEDEDVTAGVGRGSSAGYLLTTGKDALLKLWDLGTQHCLETHVTQNNGECWSMSVAPGEDGCVTAGNEGELKFWAIDVSQIAITSPDKDIVGKCLTERGTIIRSGKDRTQSVKFHPRLRYLAAHGSEKTIELFRIRTENEVRKSIARKRKRRREKAMKSADSGNANGADLDAGQPEDISAADMSEFLIPFISVRTTGKIRSFDWGGSTSAKSLRVLAATTNNQIELFDVSLTGKEDKSGLVHAPEYHRALAVDMPGHRTDVRALSLSSDDRMLVSASNGSIKIWNVRTLSCLRSLDCGYALCSAFLPGDKIVAVGNRNGELELFDISSSTLIETVKAHDGPIWTLQIHPDGRSMVTGSADKTAKFWNFEVLQEEVPGSTRKTSRFTIVQSKVLKVADDILCARFSPDARLLAIATLDNTVKVFFSDSLKLFLNLYGHKLPVLSMDISFDNKLIVTCSADKNVRLWGMDFGDCHKAFFAHQDSVMQVAFIPHNQDGNGHNFLSVSKDRSVKYWDGDKFEQIQRLTGHHGEIWAMAVSRMGDLVITASHDKSIRLWEQTEEQIFLEEEREKELEELYENTLAANLDEVDANPTAEAVGAGKQTVETLMAGEKIAEALEAGIEDLELMKEWGVLRASQPNIARPQRNILFIAHGDISAEQHVISVIEKIKASALQDALLVLTLHKVEELFVFIEIWAGRQWNVPLVCRILFFLLKTHHRQIIASKTMRPMLDNIRSKLRWALQQQKNEMGFNLAALRVIAGQINERTSKRFVDGDWEGKQQNSAKKRTFVNVA